MLRSHRLCLLRLSVVDEAAAWLSFVHWTLTVHGSVGCAVEGNMDWSLVDDKLDLRGAEEFLVIHAS